MGKMSLVGLDVRDGCERSRPSAVGMLFVWEMAASLREGASFRCFVQVTSTHNRKSEECSLRSKPALRRHLGEQPWLRGGQLAWQSLV